MNRRAFSLLELLVVVSIVAALAAMLMPAVRKAKESARSAYCMSSLRQIGMATQMYLGDSGGRFFPYAHDVSGGRYWYFGFEPNFGTGVPEGQRELDKTKAKLYPYFQTVGGIEICPSFNYQSLLYKPKFRGASYGYGINLFLVNPKPIHETALAEPSRIISFTDCAQVNTFQAPASPSNPLVEEFYFVDASQKLVQFRHNSRANVLFVDGHVESLPMAPGTLDTRLPAMKIGRLNPSGDLSLFQ